MMSTLIDTIKGFYAYNIWNDIIVTIQLYLIIGFLVFFIRFLFTIITWKSQTKLKILVNNIRIEKMDGDNSKAVWFVILFVLGTTLMTLPKIIIDSIITIPFRRIKRLFKR